jgi:hypothetical protein
LWRPKWGRFEALIDPNHQGKKRKKEKKKEGKKREDLV